MTPCILLNIIKSNLNHEMIPLYFKASTNK
jgi:hypothetical protein